MRFFENLLYPEIPKDPVTSGVIAFPLTFKAKEYSLT